MSNPVVALYDFSAKQRFIYKTNAVKEIVGASNIIKDAFSDFLKTLTNSKNFNVTNASDKDFSYEDFVKSCGDNGCEVIYEGGGNLYMIFATESLCISANRIFSRMLLDTSYGLQVICAFAKATGHFEEDRKAVYEKSAEIKRTFLASTPTNVLPFTQIDRKSSLPISKKVVLDNAPKSYSLESWLKLKKYKELTKLDGTAISRSEVFLDEIVTEKGVESLLAVIYIDGNSMGDKVMNLTSGIEDDYTKCVKKLRRFSKEVDDVFVQTPVKEIENHLAGGKKWYRLIVGGGDEITIICNARSALDIIKIYFKSIIEGNKERATQYSACAGIAIFHSHNPFSVVYKIAEECCESGKKRNREQGGENFYLDFHFCHSGITNNLKTIRKIQEEQYTNRPYCYVGNDKEHDFDMFQSTAEYLGKFRRGDVKALCDSIVKGDSFYLFEMERLKAKYGDKFKFDGDFDFKKASIKKAVFDVSIIYDLWFNSSTHKEVSENAGN